MIAIILCCQAQHTEGILDYKKKCSKRKDELMLAAARLPVHIAHLWLLNMAYKYQTALLCVFFLHKNTA